MSAKIHLFTYEKHYSVIHQNTQVTQAWNKIAKSFNCSPIEGKSWRALQKATDFFQSWALKKEVWHARSVLFLVCRYALPSAEAACHRRGENCHPKPDGPAEVSCLNLACRDALMDFKAVTDFSLFLQKGPRGGGVWGAWGVRSGCAHQYWRGQGERRAEAGFVFEGSKSTHGQ